MKDELIKRIIQAWSHVNVNVLILDDIKDLESDRAKGEENSILELGDDDVAIKKIQVLFSDNVRFLEGINGKLARYLERGFSNVLPRVSGQYSMRPGSGKI